MKGTTNRVVLGVSIAVLLLLSVILIRTLNYGVNQPTVTACKPSDLDYISVQGRPLARFQEALRFRTISWEQGKQEKEQLSLFAQFLIKEFPRIKAAPFIQTEVVSNYSLLYSVTGTDPSLQPYLLSAHLDVVPAPTEKWQHDPFGATIDDGFIYGRGAIDDKHVVMGVLEALDFLLSLGKQPKRSFYIAFGHDEEVMGYEGAKAIGKLLEARGVQLAFLLDEGLTITEGVMPGAKSPLALIGTSEKGYVTIKASVNMSGGHSSMPQPESAIGILASAVSRLEQSQHPSRLGTGDEMAMLEHAAHILPFALNMILANLWLFSSVVSRMMSSKPATNAGIRTTTAITMFKAGVKENVISPYAEAVINHRIHPTDSVQSVVDQDKAIINDPRVKLAVLHSQEPARASPHGESSFGYQVIKTSIRQVWAGKNPAVCPGIMIGNTDTRWYSKLTKNIFRFGPSYLFPEDLGRIHGVNERLSVKNYEQVINFFFHIMVNSDNGIQGTLHHEL